MMGNIIGNNYVIVCFGESHGKVIGAVIEGCPAGLSLEEKDIQEELDKRKPGLSILSSPRSEKDRIEILSGIFRGYTTGAPICMIVKNSDIDSEPYERIRNIPRPGHADYPARIRYGGYNDYRGGGRFSARRTISYIMGGAIAKKILKTILNINIKAYTIEIGGIKAKIDSSNIFKDVLSYDQIGCPDPEASELMIKKIIDAKKDGNSIGGIIECVVENVPIGLGNPCFSALDSDFAKAILSIPSVKGIEFGAGFSSSRVTGFDNNDVYYSRNGEIRTRTNNSGGIVGGLSNGMPIVIRIPFKPVSSITKLQRTLNIKTRKEVDLKVPGRHDPCVVPRAIPIVESIVAIVLIDQAIESQFIPNVLEF